MNRLCVPRIAGLSDIDNQKKQNRFSRKISKARVRVNITFVDLQNIREIAKPNSYF
jgi:hypothetical protein